MIHPSFKIGGLLENIDMRLKVSSYSGLKITENDHEKIRREEKR